MIRFFSASQLFNWVLVLSLLLVYPLGAEAFWFPPTLGSKQPTPAPTPQPSPAPGPTPAPQPTPAPETGEDSGVSEAPLEPANTRTIIVAKDGSGNYSSIQTALNNSKPGDTIQVKNGVYVERVNFTKSGTSSQPIALINYPGHTPVIDPGNGGYPTDCCPAAGTQRVEFNAEWIILKGFEIRYGWEGIKVYKGHNTIQDNWIHHNKNAGVIIVSSGNILVVGNTIEKNGIDPVACPSGKHCHGIYMSDYLCTGMSDITIKRNVISDHPGRGIQWNGADCNTVMQGTLVENNLIENNSWGIAMFYNVEGTVVRNNTIVIQSYPSTNEEYHTFVGIYGSSGNIFKNNIFYSTRSDVSGIYIDDSTSKQNTLDYNVWKVSYNVWLWGGSGRADFNSAYKTTTGWDQNGLLGSDPGFSSVANGMYYINPDSPAIDRGQNSECASTDIDLQLRLEPGNRCDIGMDESN